MKRLICCVLLLMLALTSAACAEAAPIDEATLAPEAREAYVAALENWRGELVMPDGTSCGVKGETDLVGCGFAVTDVDGDGRKELLMLCDVAVDAADTLYVYDYDEGAKALRMELCEYPLAKFYDNGVVQAYWSHNQGLSENFWPFSMYRYDAASDAYAIAGMADAWEKAFAPVGYDGKAFPDEVDASGAGIVYYVMESGDYNTDAAVDAAVYEQWVDGFFAGAEEIKVDYWSLSEESIAQIA